MNIENSVNPKSVMSLMGIPSRAWACALEGVETMHGAPYSRGEDIVRPMVKAIEVGRNALLGALFALLTMWIFNGWRRIPAASSVLAEQSANVATALSSRKITATILSFGQFVRVSDLFEKTGISSPTQGAIQRLMQAAMEFFCGSTQMNVALA